MGWTFGVTLVENFTVDSDQVAAIMVESPLKVSLFDGTITVGTFRTVLRSARAELIEHADAGDHRLRVVPVDDDIMVTTWTDATIERPALSQGREEEPDDEPDTR